MPNKQKEDRSSDQVTETPHMYAQYTNRELSKAKKLLDKLNASEIIDVKDQKFESANLRVLLNAIKTSPIPEIRTKKEQLYSLLKNLYGIPNEEHDDVLEHLVCFRKSYNMTLGELVDCFKNEKMKDTQILRTIAAATAQAAASVTPSRGKNKGLSI